MPVKYIPYYPSTVEGQAILNNFTRTRRALSYRDNDRVHDRIRRGMPFYELEKIETVGENSKNMLIRGECISACAYLKDKGVKVDLVYIDPPFASGADYAKKVNLRRCPEIARKIAEMEEEYNTNGNGDQNGGIDFDELRAFEEKMYGDIWNKEDYLNWMFENLTAIKSVMNDSASIYVHLDWHIGHYVKILMDEVFGEDNFRNEIVWWYPSGSDPFPQFNRKHDNIFWYTKDIEKWTFNFDEVAIPYTKEQEARFDQWDENRGNWYYWNINPRGERVKTFKKAGVGEYDVWNIGINASEIKEIGYATGKPQKLIDRIIKASSDEGMLVADFFGGSGVTAKVANDLKRKFIHVDVGINSIQTARDRLIAAGAPFDIYDVQDGVSLFRNPAQTMDKLKTLITGLKNEDSLDSFWVGAIHDSKLGMMPCYIPNLLDHSTKILDIPLMNRIINIAMPELPDSVKKVIVHYVDIEDEKELDAFIRENNPTDLEIELRDLKEVLDDVVINDVADFEMKKEGKEYVVRFKSFTSDRLIQKIEEYNKKKELQKIGKSLLPKKEADPDKGSDSDNENGDDEEDNDDVAVNGKDSNFTPIQISETGLELIEFISIDCKNKDGVWHSNTEIKIDRKGYVIKNGKKTKEFWDGKIFSPQKPIRIKIRNIAGDESINAI